LRRIRDCFSGLFFQHEYGFGVFRFCKGFILASRFIVEDFHGYCGACFRLIINSIYPIVGGGEKKWKRLGICAIAIRARIVRKLDL